MSVHDIETATGNWDEGGYELLIVDTDGDPHRFRATNEVAAAHVLDAARALEEYVDEAARQRRAFRGAPLNEKLMVLGMAAARDALEPGHSVRVDSLLERLP